MSENVQSLLIIVINALEIKWAWHKKIDLEILPPFIYVILKQNREHPVGEKAVNCSFLVSGFGKSG